MDEGLYVKAELESLIRLALTFSEDADVNPCIE